MSENVIQTSFSAGELSPNLLARVDFAKYRSGAATMRNFFVDYRSGASTRPGTEFIRPAALGAQKIRLVRFQQSTTVAYILEFGNHYLRFVTQGSSVVSPAIAINGISNAPAAHVTANTATIASSNALVFISGVIGMPEINNRYYVITNFTPPNGFVLLDGLTGLPVNSLDYGQYISGGFVQEVFTIGTPYAENELDLLKFSQNASVMNITHPNHPPYKLTLVSATNWSLVPTVFGATTIGPTITFSQSSATGPVSYRYTVTSVDQNNQESPNGNISLLAPVADLRLTPGSNEISWSSVPGAQAYNIYGTSPCYTSVSLDTTGMGFVGTTVGGYFTDSNIAPDFSQTPPIHDDPFTGLVFPQCSSYFQQRLVYANGGGNLVQTFWMSKTGAPYNFDVSNPPQANDSINGTLVSLEVNEIKSLIPMPTGLVALTTNGAWQINGGAGGVATQGGPVTPATITATTQAYIGANDVPPIVVNYDILFVQSKGSIVRDLTFNLYQNIYTGNDISILSSHLFYDHQIKEWAYAEEPFKIIWAVREDGILLSLTLVKEQDMYGWARHDTLGNFRSVASVTEGQFDATYVAVERPAPANVSGVQTRLSIERMADRTFQFGADDAWCVDSAVSTPYFFPNASMILSGTTGGLGPVLVTVSIPMFGATSVTGVIRFGGGVIRLTEFLTPQVCRGTILQAVTELIPNDPLKRPDVAQPGQWSFSGPILTMYGLDHLEGRPVSVLADGGVVNGLTVQNGSITLPFAATKVTVGYGFQAQLQTMPLDLGSEVNTAQGKRKKIAALTVRVKDSRAVKAGMTFDTVTPIKELNRVTTLGTSIKLVTADERIIMDPLWDIPGQICIQVDDPLPTTVLGVVPEVTLGDTSK